MVALSRSVKVGITASLISLFIYVAYVTRGGYIILLGYINNDPASVGYVHMLGLAYWASFIGLTGRFIEVALGIVILLLLWVKAWPLSKVKGLVAAAIALEAVNFISLVPSVSWLLRPGLLYNEPLGIDYLLEILLIVPFLSILAVKVAKYDATNKRSLVVWASVAFVGYVSALVVNEGARWISMIFMGGSQFLSQGVRLIGFLNAIAFMPFAIVFAALGAYRLVRGKEKSAFRWLGASLAVIGLNYAVFVYYLYYVNSLNTLPLVDAWTVPLLGLGLAMLVNSRKMADSYKPNSTLPSKD